MSTENRAAMIAYRVKQILEGFTDYETAHFVNPDLTNLTYAGLYGKGLAHDAGTKLPLAAEIDQVIVAIGSKDQADFDALTRGGTRLLVNPQAALSMELSGCNPDGASMPACPALDSAEAAGEMVEVYEMALLRDVPFSDIESGAEDTSRARTALNAFGADFKGRTAVTEMNLFRGLADGCEIGPYVSQLFLRDAPIGAHTVVQKYNYEQGVYGITEANWFEIQKGNIPVAQQADAAPKYIYNGRSLGSFVHVDFVFQAWYYALAVLLGGEVALDPGFVALANEEGFGTYAGPVDLAASLAEVSRHAIRTAWVQKWVYNMRLRPETMAQRVEAGGYAHADLATHATPTVDAVKAANVAESGDNAAYLPLQFAEGSPTHPAYPAGHATLAGACTTFLKLMLNDAQDWSTLTGIDTVVESVDGDALTSYAGSTTGMTVGTELNKLAANVALGRNMAGVHYRSDGDKGLDLGEKVAIAYVKALLSTYNEARPTLSLTKFDGSTIAV